MNNTQIIVLVSLLIVIIILGFILHISSKKRKELELKIINTDTPISVDSSAEGTTRKVFEKTLSSLISNASNNPLTFETLKSALEQKGLTVIKEGDIHTMEYNSKRVTIRENMKQCITTPCYNEFVLIKIG